MIATSKIEMDLNWYDKPKIEAIQDDKYSRNVEISLTTNGTPWEIPADCTVVVNYIKADGTGGEYDTMPNDESAWSASGNVLTVKLAPQVLTAPGAVHMDINMIKEHRAISTFRILINVHKRVATMLTASENYKNVTGFVPMPTGAVVGQCIKITEVDANGKVLETKGADIPKGALWVTVTAEADGTYTSTKTYSEIMAAHENRQGVCCTYNNLVLPLISATQFFCTFEMIHYAGEVAGGHKNYRVTIHPNGTVQVSITPLEIPTTSGGSGIHTGTEPPTDPSINVWINPDGGPDREVACYFDERIEVKTATDSVTVNLPCGFTDFHELYINTIHNGVPGNTYDYHLKLADQYVSQLIASDIKAGYGSCLYFLKGSGSVMYKGSVSNSSYPQLVVPGTYHTWSGCTASTSFSLYYEGDNENNDIVAGTTIQVYGIYHVKAPSGVINIRDSETGEWKELTALQGPPGYTPIKGLDYFTDEDKEEIAALVECTGGGLSVTDDGEGNVTITGSGAVTDDGNGNVTIPGAPGQGGYYTPEVTQPEAGKMVINWEASQEDMPPVEPKSIDLPAGQVGKSAYQYALDGGYTGTEEEFAQKMVAELPIATPDTLGGVKPVPKSEDMTQRVGVDELGGLWTAAAGGSECSLKTKKIEVAVTEAVSEIVITFTQEDAELWNNATRISVLSYCASPTPWHVNLHKTAVDGTVTASTFTASIGGYKKDITHLLTIGNTATKIETNNHTVQAIGFYARALFDSNTATISFVLEVESGDPVPPNSFMKVFIEGVM